MSPNLTAMSNSVKPYIFGLNPVTHPGMYPSSRRVAIAYFLVRRRATACMTSVGSTRSIILSKSFGVAIFGLSPNPVTRSSTGRMIFFGLGGGLAARGTITFGESTIGFRRRCMAVEATAKPRTPEEEATPFIDGLVTGTLCLAAPRHATPPSALIRNIAAPAQPNKQKRTMLVSCSHSRCQCEREDQIIARTVDDAPEPSALCQVLLKWEVTIEIQSAARQAGLGVVAFVAVLCCCECFDVLTALWRGWTRGFCCRSTHVHTQYEVEHTRYLSHDSAVNNFGALFLQGEEARWLFRCWAGALNQNARTFTRNVRLQPPATPATTGIELACIADR
jgi:hypothetical protein